MDNSEFAAVAGFTAFAAFTLWMTVSYLGSSHHLYLIEKELIERGDMMYCATTGVLDWTENCTKQEENEGG